MRSRRSLRAFVAMLALLGVLFAQLGIAAYACPMMSGAGDCCISMDSGDPALCNAHCQQGDQSLDKPAAPLVAPAMRVGTIVAMPLPAARPPPGEPPTFLSRPTAPSAAVRHCRFLI